MTVINQGKFKSLGHLIKLLPQGSGRATDTMLLSVGDEAAQSPRFTFAHDQQNLGLSLSLYTAAEQSRRLAACL